MTAQELLYVTVWWFN